MRYYLIMMLMMSHIMSIEVIHHKTQGACPFPLPLLFIYGSYCAA
jgi:hypothetical protein